MGSVTSQADIAPSNQAGALSAPLRRPGHRRIDSHEAALFPLFVGERIGDRCAGENECVVD